MNRELGFFLIGAGAGIYVGVFMQYFKQISKTKKAVKEGSHLKLVK